MSLRLPNIIFRHWTAVRNALGGVIRRLDVVLVDEGKEVRMMDEQGAREIAYVVVGAVDGPFREREERLLDRLQLGDLVSTWIVDGIRARRRCRQ